MMLTEAYEMATMITHLRVAENVFNNFSFNSDQFFAGVIAPDCSEAKEYWNIPITFETVPKISHWINDGDKINCDYNAFFDMYIKDKLISKYISFYVGYYTHLMTDVLWCKKVTAPTLEKYKDEINLDANLKKVIKQNWINLDFLYIKEHQDFNAYKVLSNITVFPNVYLPYYSDKAIEILIKKFCDFYKKEHTYEEREHIYLDAAQLNSFINEIAAGITENLLNKGLKR